MFCGMRTTGDIKDVPDVRAFAMANLIVTKRGAASIRPGFDKQNTTSLGTSTLGLFGFSGRKTGSQTVICCNGTDIDTI